MDDHTAALPGQQSRLTAAVQKAVQKDSGTLREGERERERERERETEGERDRGRERETERDREGERERQRETSRGRERDQYYHLPFLNHKKTPVLG